MRKKKNLRKYTAWMLAFLMVLTMMPAMAFAAEDDVSVSDNSLVQGGGEPAIVCSECGEVEGIHLESCSEYTPPEESGSQELPEDTEDTAENTDGNTEENTDENTDETAVEQVRALLEALPDPHTLEGESANAPAEEIAAARAAFDALTEKQQAQIDAALTEKLAALEHIRDTVKDCLDFDCPYHYTPEVLAAMNENENPEPLTLDDLVADYGVEPPMSAFSLRRGAATPHPQTIVITEDNEDNAHSGTPDGDVDTHMDFGKFNYPVEVSFTLTEDNFPTQSAYVAIKAFDVNEEAGESDHVYLNDDIFMEKDAVIKDVFGDEWHYYSGNIGMLSGTGRTWNTTILQIPLEKLKLGKNVISITIKHGWWMMVDWMQVILDGGAQGGGVESFDLSLGTPVSSGAGVQVPATVTIQQTGNVNYLTEYTLLEPATGNALDAAFGTASATETVNLTLPAGAAEGVYNILGMIKHPDTEKIMAFDEASILYEDGRVTRLAAVSHTLSPSGLTNGDVEIALDVTAEGALNYTITSNTGLAKTGDNTFTATQNGSYSFTVAYTLEGVERETSHTVNVSNIDKTPPEFTYEPFTVIEDTPADEVKTLMNAAIAASDDRQLADDPISFATDFVAAHGEQTVAVTVTDAAGNTITKDCTVTVSPKPLELTLNTPVRVSDEDSFNLTADLNYTGGLTITESGVVWGVTQNPTVTVNNGSAKAASPVTEKGGSFTLQATDIVEGANYYARAWVKDSGGVYHYSVQQPFSIGGKNYGTFTVQNNENNTFTISRTNSGDGTLEGGQTVHYRTVNGSAVGGTHFTHAASTVTFGEGETSKTVTITENGVTAAYSSKPATSYSNADRTYQLEIYRVDGGGVLGSTTKAARTMVKNSGYVIDRTIYSEWKAQTKSDEVRRGDYDKDGYGWTENAQGSAAQETFKIADTPGFSQREYWANTADAIKFWLQFTAREANGGYQHIQITPGQSLDLKIHPEDGSWEGTRSTTLYVATFEHGGGGTADKDYATYYFPKASGSNTYTPSENFYGTQDGDQYVRLPATTEYVSIGYTGSGTGEDGWLTKDQYNRFMLKDTKEPQLLGMAPMAGGQYKPGDPITVALVFDEIVDKANSEEAGLTSSFTINTNYGVMTYAGGLDTNVLYFTGTVPANATETVEFQSFSNAAYIKDMCGDTTGTTSSGSGSSKVTVDTTVPVISIVNQGVTNGVATGKITASNCDTLRYVWTQSASMPVGGWLDCQSGNTVTTRQEPGTWYLHVLGYREANASSTWKYAAFDFTTSPIPTLTASADNSQWAQSRDIAVTHRPAKLSVTYTGPQSGNIPAESGSGTASNTVTVTANGTYTFTFVSGDETVTQTVAVSRIDRIFPSLSIRGPMNGEDSANTIYNALPFVITAGDTLSGVAKVEYVFTNSAEVPEDGWTTAAGTDGSYAVAYTATEINQTQKYLHVRVTDAAGNVKEKTSDAYTVIKPAVAADLPAITLTGAPTGWTKGPVTLTWTVTKEGAGDYTVYLGGETSTEQSGTLKVTQNGLVSVFVVDKNGESGSAKIMVNYIDAEAPTLTAFTGSTGTTNTVTFSGLTDDLSMQIDECGNFTNYSGSGIDKRQWRKAGATDWQDFTGDSVTVDAAGTYEIKLTDQVRNENTYTFDIHSVAFDTRGNIAGGIDSSVSAPDTQLVLSGEFATEPTAPQQAGYAFRYWKNGTTKYDFNSSVQSNLTLTALWGLTDPTVNLTADRMEAAYTGQLAITLTAAPSHPTPGVTYTYEWYKKAEGGSGSVKVANANGPTLALTNVEDSGEYTVKVKASDGVLESNVVESSAVDVAITPAQGTASVTMESWVYDGQGKTPVSVSATNGIADVTYSYSGKAGSSTNYSSADCPSDAGEYTVKAIFAATPNYAEATAMADFTISKRPVSAAWGSLLHVYDNTAKSPQLKELTGILQAHQGDDSAIALDINNEGTLTDAGTQTFTIALTGSKAANYVLLNSSVVLTVQRAPVAFTIADSYHNYDGSSHVATITARTMAGAEVADSDFTVAYYDKAGNAVSQPAAAGSYEIRATLTNANYRHSDGPDGAERKIGVLTIYENTMPTTYTVTFAPGEGASGTMPSLPEALAETIHVLPAQGNLTKSGYVFVGWELDGKTYEAGEEFTMPAADVTFTARWKQAAYSIGGVVDQEGQPMAGVVVRLMRGSKQVAETLTDEGGGYRFDDVIPDLYNLVASYGGIIQTVKCLIVDHGEQVNISLPEGKTNSVLEVKEGTPTVIVGNLEKIFAATDSTVFTADDKNTVDAGGEVEIRMTVEELQQPETQDAALFVTGMENLPDDYNYRIGLYLEMGLIKTVAPVGETATKTDVPESSVILESTLALPAELQGYKNYAVLRVHENADGEQEVHVLTENKNADGEYFTVNSDKTELVIHARKYSVYAIAVSNYVVKTIITDVTVSPADDTVNKDSSQQLTAAAVPVQDTDTTELEEMTSSGPVTGDTNMESREPKTEESVTKENDQETSSAAAHSQEETIPTEEDAGMEKTGDGCIWHWLMLLLMLVCTAFILIGERKTFKTSLIVLGTDAALIVLLMFVGNCSLDIPFGIVNLLVTGAAIPVKQMISKEDRSPGQ